MSIPRKPEPVKLFVSILANDKALVIAVIQRLAERYGRMDYISEFLSFPYTDYYTPEMGASLTRRFLTFEELVSPEVLPDTKLFTNSIEAEFADSGRRAVNIDPGYIAQANFILATGKNFAHRPYLQKGIYADLTLVYKQQTFRALDWTYPDYGDAKTIRILNTLRQKYLSQLIQLR